MTTVHAVAVNVLVILVCSTGWGCSLKRPDVIPARMLEPELAEPAAAGGSGQASSAPTTILRLHDTLARGHIGLRLLHQETGGELSEDPVWRWTSTPDRYLDSALRVTLASTPGVRLVDTANAPALAITLLAWQLDSTGDPQLVGAVELSVTAADRSVRTQIIRMSEPVSAELPGNLSAAAGRLLYSLALESVSRGIRATSSPPP